MWTFKCKFKSSNPTYQTTVYSVSMKRTSEANMNNVVLAMRKCV